MFNSKFITKGNKAYYLPKKQELLNYRDHEYFEKTKEYKTLLQYVKKNFFKNQAEKAEWLCEEIYGNCQFGGGINGSIEAFDSYGIIFKDEKQVNEIVELIIALSNNILIWENNGHTPSELPRPTQKSESEIFMDSVIDSLDEESLHDVGRNDRCPCGSGKKFKMCCLKGLH